jgi:hypothetical protein
MANRHFQNIHLRDLGRDARIDVRRRARGIQRTQRRRRRIHREASRVHRALGIPHSELAYDRWGRALNYRLVPATRKMDQVGSVEFFDTDRYPQSYLVHEREEGNERVLHAMKKLVSRSVWNGTVAAATNVNILLTSNIGTGLPSAPSGLNLQDNRVGNECLLTDVSLRGSVTWTGKVGTSTPGNLASINIRMLVWLDTQGQVGDTVSTPDDLFAANSAADVDVAIVTTHNNQRYRIIYDDYLQLKATAGGEGLGAGFNSLDAWTTARQYFVLGEKKYFTVNFKCAIPFIYEILDIDNDTPIGNRLLFSFVRDSEAGAPSYDYDLCARLLYYDSRHGIAGWWRERERQLRDLEEGGDEEGVWTHTNK